MRTYQQTLIYREIEQFRGITLKKFSEEAIKLANKRIGNSYNLSATMRGKTLKKFDEGENSVRTPKQVGFEEKPSVHQEPTASLKTAYSELEVIEIGLKIIELLSLLHDKDIVHTNLCPETIFLRNGDIEHLCFFDLYSCSYNLDEQIKIDILEEVDNSSMFDLRTRDICFVAPEQLKLGEELKDIAQARNQKVEETSPEMLEFSLNNRNKLNKQCDIFSLGAIMFFLLMGTPPDEDIPDLIVKHKFIDRRPESNIYQVPPFFDGFVMSNDLCFIMVKLLCANTQRR